jgi:hypothetical protein
MINVKFEYNSETETAKYTIMKDDVQYDDEYVIELNLPFNIAHSLSGVMDELIFLSSEDGYNKLLMKLDGFVNSHYSISRYQEFYPNKK